VGVEHGKPSYHVTNGFHTFRVGQNALQNCVLAQAKKQRFPEQWKIYQASLFFGQMNDEE